jgi:hypothetical protein
MVADLLPEHLFLSEEELEIMLLIVGIFMLPLN